MILRINTIPSQLTKTQEAVLRSILEDIFYLENTLQIVKNKNLISLARISITFNYISLETFRDFYCERLSIRKDKGTGNYNWRSFFIYPKHIENIDAFLKKRSRINFKNANDMEKFIDTLRIQRNLVLHRKILLNKKHNKKLQGFLNNITRQSIKEIFIKSRNCIEIMNYIMKLKHKRI